MISKNAALSLLLAGIIKTFRDKDKEVVTTVQETQIAFDNAEDEGKINVEELREIIGLVNSIPEVVDSGVKDLYALLERASEDESQE